MRKFAREWVAKYPSIAKINDSIAGPRRMGSEETVTGYVKGVRKFTKFVKVEDPEVLLSKLLTGEIDAGKQVDQFIDYALKDLVYAHNHVRNLVFGIKKWLDLNGVKVDWKAIQLPTSTEISEEDRAPSKPELQRLLNHASGIRDKAIIYCDTSSGLRIGTMLSLKVGNVDFGYSDVARFTVQRKAGRKFSTSRSGSQGRLFVTWITGEAKAVLQQYLKEREAAGEKLTAESPLFTDAYHKGHVIGLEDYQKVWARLLRRAGLAKKSNKWFELRLHTLRKYFRSNCIGVDQSYRERWMGHKGLYLDMSYFKAEEDLHLQEYRKAIPHLIIQPVATDEKRLRLQMLVDTAKLWGSNEDEIKKIQEIYARTKDVDKTIEQFRKFKDSEEDERPLGKAGSMFEGNGRYVIAHSEDELIKKLDEGYTLKTTLTADKFLLESAD